MKRGFLIVLLMAVTSAEAVGPSEFRFQFGTNQAQPGWTRITVTNQYSPVAGFGFVSFTSLGAGRDFVASDQPFAFSVQVPAGNYHVVLELGSTTDSENTIKAEARRLMLERVPVGVRETVRVGFTINVRRPEFPMGKVRLKQRELDTETVTWDDKLTLEFLGPAPSLRSMEIVRTNVPKVFLN